MGDHQHLTLAATKRYLPKMAFSKTVLLLLGMVVVSMAIPAMETDDSDADCAEWEEVQVPDETSTIPPPDPTEASIGMCSCSRGFTGNYINWQSCGEGYSPDTWWSLFKHCWCRCCSEGEEEGTCGDWSS